MSDSATETAKGIMRSISEVLDIPDNRIEAVVDIVTGRVAAFLTDDEYADARECLRLRSIHPNYIMALIVADAINLAAKLPGVTSKGVAA